jgi:hypothetical protein
MIPHLPGWTACHGDDHVELSSADGTIRYVERLRPVAPLAELARRHGGTGRPRTFLTVEGEYAAVVDSADGAVGFVVIEDWYALTVGTARGPAARARVAAAVAELVAADRHMLGARRRWYRYQGPPGWTRRPRGSVYSHVWRPGDPADWSELVVEAAWPVRAGTEPGPDPDGFVARERSAAEPVRAAGLSGELVTWTGDAGALRLRCVLSGRSHVHVLRLDTERARLFVNRALFLDVVRSIRPVPSAPAVAGVGLAAAHWAD